MPYRPLAKSTTNDTTTAVTQSKLIHTPLNNSRQAHSAANKLFSMENSIAARQCHERSDGHMCGSPRHAWMILAVAHGGAGPRPAWQRVEDAQICSRWSRYELGRAQGTSTRERSAVRSPERLRARVAHAQAVRHSYQLCTRGVVPTPCSYPRFVVSSVTEQIVAGLPLAPGVSFISSIVSTHRS